MRISLDYDKTYTADKKLWDDFIRHALSRDHEVVIVTFRSKDCPIDYNKYDLDVYYTSAYPKKCFMEEKGISIDIWIDDDPDIIINGSGWTDVDRERWRQENGF